MAGVLDRLARGVRLWTDRGAPPQRTVPPSPTVNQREQIAAIIRRDFPFMSDDCIKQVLSDM